MSQIGDFMAASLSLALSLVSIFCGESGLFTDGYPPNAFAAGSPSAFAACTLSIPMES
jgi:hypothetical protein